MNVLPDAKLLIQSFPNLYIRSVSGLTPSRTRYPTMLIEIGLVHMPDRHAYPDPLLLPEERFERVIRVLLTQRLCILHTVVLIEGHEVYVEQPIVEPVQTEAVADVRPLERSRIRPGFDMARHEEIVGGDARDAASAVEIVRHLTPEHLLTGPTRTPSEHPIRDAPPNQRMSRTLR